MNSEDSADGAVTNSIVSRQKERHRRDPGYKYRIDAYMYAVLWIGS